MTQTGVTSCHPNLKLGTREENLPSGSTGSRHHQGDAPPQPPVAASPTTCSPRCASWTEAERHTRHDGSEWIELSDGQPLPNAQRALMFTRYSPEARYS